MATSKLPTEVELIYEVMPCIAMRAAQEPSTKTHPCTYFRNWGSYHSYDYKEDGPPGQDGIEHPSVYVGLAPLHPEVLSGCRKSPIIAIGINPNLSGYWSSRKNSVYPSFNDYKQYAHYFRYRTTDKLEIPKNRFEQYDDHPDERPPSLENDLDIPNNRVIPLQKQPVTFYEELQSILDDLGDEMNWNSHKLEVGEDLAYMNMVACPSARWLTRPTNGYPSELIMSRSQNRGIVNECFHQRKYFLRQLFQSLPKVILVISSTTAKAFIRELEDLFIQGNPRVGESIDDLSERKHVLKYGELPNGTDLTARVVFSHHITGNNSGYQATRGKVMRALIDEARNNNLRLNSQNGHLRRPLGSCSFCPMLELGNCDYQNELRAISDDIAMPEMISEELIVNEKSFQNKMIDKAGGVITEVAVAEDDLGWTEDDVDFQDPITEE